MIDGNEGCGKSTIVKMLKEHYSKNRKFIFTREPGGTTLAEDIRGVMLSENARQADGFTQFSLVWASRRDHIRNLIAPSLEKGINIISDRFDSTTWAIQIYAQQDSKLKNIFDSIRNLCLGKVKPDLYIYLDVEPKEGMRRVTSRNATSKDRKTATKSHFHDQKVDYYIRMRRGFMAFIKKYRGVKVDANQPVEKVFADVVALIEKIS